MNEIPMLFPVEPNVFWGQMKELIEKVISEKLNVQKRAEPIDLIPQKPLLKLADVCTIFQISKPTVYQWVKMEKLHSFKIQGRRFFLRQEVEALIKRIS